jgi:hypothetical protein
MVPFLNHVHQMKIVALCLICWGALLSFGCEAPVVSTAAEKPQCGNFLPASVHIAGLTQLLDNPDSKQPQTLRVFVELRDLYDSKLKAPFTLRIELYKSVPHIPNRRGLHLQTWPDFDLTDLNTNQAYWQDYLRAYEFMLKVDPPVSRTEALLLEVTCHTGQSQILSNTYLLNPQ